MKNIKIILFVVICFLSISCKTYEFGLDPHLKNLSYQIINNPKLLYDISSNFFQYSDSNYLSKKLMDSLRRKKLISFIKKIINSSKETVHFYNHDIIDKKDIERLIKQINYKEIKKEELIHYVYIKGEYGLDFYFIFKNNRYFLSDIHFFKIY
jgi:hypothetical protein